MEGDLSKQDGNKITTKDIYGNMDPKVFFDDFTLEKQKRKKIERDKNYELFYDLNLTLILSKNILSSGDLKEITKGVGEYPPHFENISSLSSFNKLASAVFRYRNLARIQYLTNSAGSGAESWNTLTQVTLNDLSPKKALLCRLVVLKPIKNTDLPIYNEHFYLYKNTEETVVTQAHGQTATAPAQVTTAVPIAAPGGGGMTGGGGTTGGGGGY